MIKKIINYIEYKKKVKLLKMFAINKITNYIVDNKDYIQGFEKLLLTMAKSDDATELQKMLDEYIKVAKATKTANKVAKENK